MNGPGDPPDRTRTSPRVEILGELHGELMVFQPMIVREISRSGVLVETGFPLHVNSLHELRLTLGSKAIVVKGRVVHCSIADVEQERVTYRSGLEFIEPPDHADDAIVSFVGTIQDVRSRR